MHEDSESAGNSDSDNQIHALLFCFAFVLIRSPVLKRWWVGLEEFLIPDLLH
jgi:hypothetical protein